MYSVSGTGWMWDGPFTMGWRRYKVVEVSGFRWMGWVNIWEQVKWPVFLRDEHWADLQSMTELLQCGLGKGLEDFLLGWWDWCGSWMLGLEVCMCFISGNSQECVQTDL